MGDAGGIRAGRAYVELYGDDSTLNETLDKSEQKVTGWGSRIAGSGRAVASTFGAAIMAVGSTAAVAASATVALGSAGIAALGFGGSSVVAAAGTLQIVAALQSLQSVGSRAWDFLSAGVGRGNIVFRGVLGLVSVLTAQLAPLGAKFATVAANIQAIADAANNANGAAVKMSAVAVPKKSAFGDTIGALKAEAGRAASSIHGELSERFPKIMSGVDAIAGGAVSAVRVVVGRLVTEMKGVSAQMRDQGSVASQLAASAQKGARRGQYASFLTGDKQAHSFYTEARSVADGATVAAAFSKSFQSGVETRLRIAARRGVTSGLSGFAGLLNTATLGAGSAVMNVGRGIARSMGVIPAKLQEVGGEAVKARGALSLMADGLRSATGAAGSFFRMLSGKAAVVSGIAAGIVGMGSVAAGFDMRTVGARIMNSKSFAEGAEGLNKRGNAMVSQADVQKAAALKTAMEGLFQAAEMAWAQIGAAVAPVITQSLTATTQLVAGLARWIAKNRELVGSVFAIAMPIFKVSAGVALFLRYAAMLAPAVGLILSPIGLIAAALAGGVALWLWWSDSGNAAVTWLAGRFSALTEIFGQSWGGIVDAVSAGDLALAGQIAWTGLKLGLFTAIREMGGSWSAFSKFALQAFAAIGDAWDVVLAGFSSAWRRTQQFISHGIVDVLGFIEGRDTTEDHKNVDEDANRDVQKIAANRERSMVARVAKLQQDLASLPESDEAEIDRLKEQLAGLVKTARENKADPFAAVMTAPEKPGKGAETDAGKIREHAITGTFNAAAVQGMAVGSSMDQVAENTKAALIYLKAMAAVKKQNGVFAGGGF
jgi:hypothetical protein